MADQLMTTTELAAVIPETWSSKWYDTLLTDPVLVDSVARDYEGEISALGDTVNVTQFNEVEAVEIAENEAVSAQSSTPTNIQLIVNKMVAYDYIVTTRADKQSLNHVNALRNNVMHAILKKMQAIMLALIVPSASAPDHQIAYDSGTTLALADMLGAKELLDGANVPDDGSRCMITDAPQWNDVFNITGFTSRDYIPAGSPLSSGSLPTPILGFKAKLSTVAANKSYFFHPSFMQLAVQQQPSVEVFNMGAEGKRALRVNTTVLFGVKQFSNVRVVQVG